MTVTAVNDNPTATNDAATVVEDSGATVVDVLANDSFAPDTGETLTVTAVTQGTNGGTVTLVGGRRVVHAGRQRRRHRDVHLHHQRRQRRDGDRRPSR